MLQFVYPSELAEGGRNTFPLTVPSLAGRVIQMGRSVLMNAMRDVPHLGIYERPEDQQLLERLASVAAPVMIQALAG